MAQMRARILELEAQLALTGGSTPVPSGAVQAMVQPEEMLMLKVQNETFETEIKRLNTRLKDVREQLSEISDKLVVVETERDSYKLKLQRMAGISDATIAAGAPGTTATVGGSTEGAATRIGFELGIDNGEITVMQELHKHKHKLQKKLKRKSSALDSALSMIERYQQRFGDLAPHRNGTADTKDAEDGAGSDKDDGDDSDGGATRRRLRKLNGGHLTSGGNDDIKEDEGLDDSEEEEDHDIKDLTDAAARKEREMSNMMTDMNRTQAELESDISDKTDLLQELTKAREHAQFMRRQYEAKITEMQNEKNGILAEREKAMSSVRNDEKAVAKIAEKYEKQLKSLEVKLVEMKKKISDNDRLKRLYAADEAKIKQLNEEISSTKKRMVELTRQKTEKMKEHREWVTENNAKMKTVLRENETNRGLLKKMKSDLDKQSALLKRRNEEKAQLQKKVNKLEAAPKKAAAGVAAAAASAPGSGAAIALRNNFMKTPAKSTASPSVAAKKPRHRRNVSDSKVDAYDDSDFSTPSSRELAPTDLQTQLEKEIEDGVRNLEARDELEGMQQASRLLDQTQRDLEQKLLVPAPQEVTLEWQDSLMFCREERGFLAKRMEAKRKELDAYSAGEAAANQMDPRAAAPSDARVWQRVRLPQESRPLLKFLAEQVCVLHLYGIPEYELCLCWAIIGS
jgi:septal ring factor EnvC (AmiA/AmiB activator)